jgi:hypothetical protein
VSGPTSVLFSVVAVGAEYHHFLISCTIQRRSVRKAGRYNASVSWDTSGKAAFLFRGPLPLLSTPDAVVDRLYDEPTLKFYITELGPCGCGKTDAFWMFATPVG